MRQAYSQREARWMAAPADGIWAMNAGQEDVHA